MALVGTGAAGAFAPVNFKQGVHVPVFKRLFELFSITMLRKSLDQSAKLPKLMLSSHFLLF